MASEDTMHMDKVSNRIKQLELLGGIGAGILGAGAALLFARWLQAYAVPILLIGIAAHGWAMFAKGRLECLASGPQPRWVVAAEGICWGMISGLILYVVAKLWL